MLRMIRRTTFRQGVGMTVVLEPLGSESEMQRIDVSPLPMSGAISCILVDQRLLQLRRFLEAPL